MGTGIAQVLAQADHQVRLYDQDATAVARARAGLSITLTKLAEKGKFTPAAAADTLGRISIAPTLTGLADCGLVIEAIAEKLDAKQQLFRALEAAVSPACVLATNTSSLSVTAIAAACQQPERCVGLHFFNPAPVLPLVEVVAAAQTRPGLAEEMRALVLSWGKQPVLAQDTPGFIVNRVARPFYGEAIRLLEEGIADAETIDWAMTTLGGFRMGPFALMDFIGHDVNYRVTEAIFAGFFYDPRYQPSFTQKRLVEAGYLGRKTGRGFYQYAAGTPPPAPAPNEALGTTVLHRILAMLINEAAEALYLRIATATDLELAMTSGVNYPKGLLAWADELGPARVLAILDELFATYHDPRYRASPLLRQLAATGQRFLA